MVIYETSTSELEIIRDISRTFPSHIFFQQRHGPGQRSLYNVLKAYSVYDRDVGYVQVRVQPANVLNRVEHIPWINILLLLRGLDAGNGIYSWVAASLYERRGCILVNSSFAKRSRPCSNGRLVSGD